VGLTTFVSEPAPSLFIVSDNELAATAGILPSVPGIGPVASHHNPILKAFADRLRAAGELHKVIITAVARKLVTIANAMCKSQQTWANQAA